MSPTPELAERIRWFIRLRWLAVGGILIAAAVVAALGLAVSWRHLFGLAGLLAALNVVYAGLSRRGVSPLPFTWWQIVADLTVLTLALHVSGGIENPFAFFYVFHVIIASILLPRGVSYLVAGLATLFFFAMAILEHTRFLSHTELGFVRWQQTYYLVGASAVIASTLFSSSYLASTIMEGLRRKDEEMRRFNERLLQTEKLAAIGQLAAGIAHELNTPLASIAGYAEELGEIVKGSDGKVLQYTDVIRSQTERCKAITQSLLNFARKSEIRVQAVDVNAVVREAIDYLRFKKRAPELKIETVLGDVPRVQADPGQLLQVFLSILVNAADAIQGGGRITVKSRADRDVQVVVTDTGGGIPAENLKKVFEPFFTTKEPGQGTGLGLSLSYGIVKQMGGSIDLKSKVGEGTEVTIALPR
ncbi:MAG TPA: ATP-binding protein [Planctomycetota bacterium]|nr:ATP-binding protein [Planctomycetota bacterium]